MVETEHVMQVLRPLWSDRTETATRVRQRIETVLSWATVSGLRSGLNPARWADHLRELLPQPSKIRKVEHHPALPWAEVPEFIVQLRKREGIAARALEFAILTAARSGEVRGARWSEFDLDARVWTVPADRMKAGKVHRVPLSVEALAILGTLPRLGDHVFTAPRGSALSDMAISAVCRRMQVAAVPHGFRSSFKDWCRNSARFPDEVSELALAHVNSDATRAAYARDELMPQRRELMQQWAEFCAPSPT
jgi:integrase